MSVGAVRNSEGSLLPANRFEKHGAMELSLKGDLNCVGKLSQEKLDRPTSGNVFRRFRRTFLIIKRNCPSIGE
jgi:hypothetical protein